MNTYYLGFDTDSFWIGYLEPDLAFYWKGWDNSRSSFVYQKGYASINEFIELHSCLLYPISEHDAHQLSTSSRADVLSFIKANYPEVLL